MTGHGHRGAVPQETTPDEQAADVADPTPEEEPGLEAEPFDFDAHGRQAAEAYQGVAGQYADFARAIHGILNTCIDGAGIKVHSIEPRGKDAESFRKKASQPSEDNPNLPSTRSRSETFKTLLASGPSRSSSAPSRRSNR